MNPLTERPSALVITRNLPPLVGGMERLVWHIVDELRAEYRVHVIGPKGCASLLPEDVHATEVPTGPMYQYLLCTKLSVLRCALRIRPRIVLAGSGLTAPFAWIAARLTGARCIAYLHGLDIEAQHQLYRLFWRPFFRSCDQVLVNSNFTKELATGAGVASERIKILHPGVALPDLDETGLKRIEFRKEHSLGNAPIVLYVGRITARKGLAVFVRDIFPKVVAARPDVRLVVVGDEPTEALQRQSGEQKRIIQALSRNGLSQKVLFLTNLSDSALHSAYFSSDVLVFPVQERPNDHEGFGMVAMEAAAHGLPTVAFAVGGVVDAVLDNCTGNLIAPADNDAFSQAVIDRITTAFSDRFPDRESIKACTVPFAWPTFGERLRKLCREIDGGLR